MANQDDHNQKISFSTWYTNKFGGRNTFILLIMWLFGGFIWIPAMYLYTGKKRGDLDESSKNKCIIAIGLSVLVLFFNIYIDPYIQKAEAEKKQIAAQLVAKEKAEKKAELEKKIAKEFSDNQESILSNAKQLFDQGNYPSVIALSSKYAAVHNQQLEEFGQEARRMEKRKRLRMLGNHEGLYIGMPMEEAIEKFNRLLKGLGKCYNSEAFFLETTELLSFVPPFQDYVKLFRPTKLGECSYRDPVQLWFVHNKLYTVQLDSVAASYIFKTDVSSKNFIQDFTEANDTSITNMKKQSLPDGVIFITQSFRTSKGDPIEITITDKGGNIENRGFKAGF